MKGFGSAPPSPEQVDRLLIREDSEFFEQFAPEERLEAIKQVLKDNQPVPVIGREHSPEEMERIKEDLARQERGEELLGPLETSKPKGPSLVDKVRVVLESRKKVLEV